MWKAKRMYFMYLFWIYFIIYLFEMHAFPLDEQLRTCMITKDTVCIPDYLFELSSVTC